jgi:hypothetical protein
MIEQQRKKQVNVVRMIYIYTPSFDKQTLSDEITKAFAYRS